MYVCVDDKPGSRFGRCGCISGNPAVHVTVGEGILNVKILKLQAEVANGGRQSAQTI